MVSFVCSFIGLFALVLGSPFRRGGRPLIILVCKPILFGIVQWVDHFWHQLVLFSNLKHRACVLVPPTVVRCRENGEKLPARETFEAVHDTLVRTQNVLRFVCLEEVLDPIWSKFDNISGSIWISNKVGLDTQILIRISRVRPKDVNHKLLFTSGNLMNDLQRPLNLLNLVQIQKGTADASV